MQRTILFEEHLKKKNEQTSTKKKQNKLQHLKIVI